MSADEAWLPPRRLWPERVYALDHIKNYPDRFNSTDVLLDQQVAGGRGDHPAVLYGDEAISYADLVRQVNRLGNALRALGVGEGDRVLLRSLNEPPALVANFAALKLGAVSVPTSPLLTADQIAHIGRDCEPSVLVVCGFLLTAVLTARPQIPSLRHVIVFGVDRATATSHGCLLLEDLVAGQDAELAPVLRPQTAVSVLLYTSGLLEPARATAHLQNELLIIPDIYGRYGFDVQPDDVISGAGPMSFAGGYSTMATIPYRFGATAAIIPLGTPPSAIFEIIRRHGVTLLAALPTWYREMLKVEDVDPADIKTLRMVGGGGEQLDAETLTGWRERFGLDIYEGFGTNGMMYVFISNAVHRNIRPGSMGTPLPGYEVRLLTPAGDEAAVGEPGRLHARGPVGTLFWGNPSAAAQVEARQAATTVDGWVRIGDWVTRDADGYLYFVAREEDLLVRDGVRFGPGEVEAALTRNPAVAEAGVYGAGDEVRALVVLRATVLETGALPREILNAARSHLDARKIPDELTIVDQLPRTQFGTLRRRAEWPR